MTDLPLVSRLLSDGTLRLETPRVFLPMLRPARFKGMRGGRGGAKSHFVAERLIATCFERRVRAACLREFQSSIKESVKQLLEDKIAQFGQQRQFHITEAEIRGPNESHFVFKGLHEYVSRTGGLATALQLLEGFTHAWGEEAQSFSQRSLDILTPTFRGRPGDEYPPELWFTWNPRLRDDPIERFFNDNEGDPDFVCVTTTFDDNPWFEASGLRRDMERMKRRDYQKYLHIWRGEYLTRSEAQVFQNWRVDEFETPADARFRYGADFGFANDATTLIRCFIVGHDLYVDYEAYAVGCRIEATPALFLTVPEAKKWRIRADCSRPETIDYMRRRGFRVTPAVKGKDSVEEGIEFLKDYDIVIHERCEHTIAEFAKYSYKVNPRNDDVMPRIEEGDDHCIAEGELITTARGDIPIEQVVIGDLVLTRAGYRRVLFAGCTGRNRDTVIVETTGGSVRCTPDHEVWIIGKGFVSADELRYADEVVSLEPRRCQSIQRALDGKVTFIINTVRIVTLEGLLMVLGVFFTGICGSSTRDLFRRVTRSITGTRISHTTRSRILNVLRMLSTLSGIPIAMSAASGRQSISLAYDILPSRGTLARRDWQSIGRSALWPMPNSSRFRRFVRGVVRISCRASSVISIASARIGASLPGVVPLVGTMKLGFASSAGMSSRLTSISGFELVRGHVLTVSPGGKAERVYDLTIEDQHEFFVNNQLVANCIDALRYAVEDDRRGGRPIVIPQTVMQSYTAHSRDRFSVSSARNRFARAR